MVRRRGPTRSYLAVRIESFGWPGRKTRLFLFWNLPCLAESYREPNNVIASAAKQSILTWARLHRVYQNALGSFT
jgi:hypothetical protein